MPVTGLNARQDSTTGNIILKWDELAWIEGDVIEYYITLNDVNQSPLIHSIEANDSTTTILKEDIKANNIVLPYNVFFYHKSDNGGNSNEYELNVEAENYNSIKDFEIVRDGDTIYFSWSGPKTGQVVNKYYELFINRYIA